MKQRYILAELAATNNVRILYISNEHGGAYNITKTVQ